MIDLYALTSPNVVKVFLMLEECALPYNVIPVDVWKGAQFSAEFMKVNPNSKVPAIVDHEGPGGKPYTVFESGAILMYLADKVGKFLPRETGPRYEAIQWLMWQMAGIGPYSGQLVHFKNFAPKGEDYSRSRYQTEVLRLYEVLEKRLAQSAYIGGPEYGVADVATFPWARNRAGLGVKDETHPNIKRWFDSIVSRPAVTAALAKVATVKSSRDTASSEDFDRIFGRGKFARA